MEHFKILRHLFVVLVISHVHTLRISNPLYNQGRSIFRDDYGSTIKESDCPSLEDNPKLIYNNETHYSSYFSLSCVARYPIDIDFNGNKPFLPIARFLVANADPENMTNACYVIHINQYFNRDLTSPVGNYTCRSVHDERKTSSQYIFVQNTWGWRFQNSFNVEKDQVIYVNENTVSKFVIPCVANKETLQSPILKKEAKGTADETKVALLDGFKVQYDRYQGFIVDYTKPINPLTTTLPPSTTTLSSHNEISTISTRPFSTTAKSKSLKTAPVTGKYVCVDPSALSTQDVTVKHADFLVFPNRTNVTFDKDSLTFECYSNKPVSLKVLDPSSKLGQKEEVVKDSKYSPLGFTYGAKTTFSTTDPKAIGRIRIACMQTSDSKSLYEWNIDNSYICKCEWNNTYNERSNRRYYYPYSQEEPEFGETPDSNQHQYNTDWEYFEPPYYDSQLTCYNNKANIVDFTFHHCQNPTECGLFQKSCDKYPQSCDSLGQSYYYYPIIPASSNRTTKNTLFTPGIIKCTADGYLSNINVTTDWKGGMYFNDNSYQSDSEIMHIRASESHVFTGDSMLYSCMGSSSTIANPIIWGFKLDNGNFNYSHYNFDSYNWWQDRLQMQRSISAMRTTYLQIPEKKTSELFCFAPRWDSKKWAQTSVQLKVEDGAVVGNPPPCPSKSNPFIVMYRNSSSISRNRLRLPHLVNDKDALVFDPVDTVSLYCLAKYPVIWSKDELNVTAARLSRANCKREDGSIVLRYLYKSTVNFKINSFNATGNYTCKSISPHKSRQTSTYIYAMSPENRTTFVDEGKHHIIYHKWTNNSRDWVVLPCRLNTPYIRPHLFLDIPEEERVEKVPYDKRYLSFDPKVGFSIDITNKKVIRGKKTILFCSDHEDGSFIGTMITLELIYENPKPSHNMTLTTTTLSSSLPSMSTSSVLQSTTTHPPTQVVSASTGTPPTSNSGFIVTTILLSAVCVACVGIIYHLYQKVRVQTNKQTSSQELDWTRALAHPPPPTSIANKGNGVMGNGIHSSVSTYPNPDFTQAPNILESLDSNSLIAHEQINDNECLVNVGCTDQDRSLSSLSDDDFGYKKL